MNWTGEEIKELRLRLGWCQANLARRLNCSLDLLEKWEANQSVPSAEYLPKFKYLLDCVDSNVETLRMRTHAEVLLKQDSKSQVTHDDIILNDLI